MSLRRRLSAILQHNARVRLAVLFGSRARGEAREDSDVDVAIWWESKPALGEELALEEALSRSVEAEVQLVDLESANLLLRHRVASEGECLRQAEPGLWTRYRVRALSDWIDFGPSYQQACRRYLSRVATEGL